MADRPLGLAIIGGGIAGLNLALCLTRLIPDHRRHFDIDIYESTGSLRAQVGVGIGLWPFSWVVLEEMGLAEEFYKYSPFRQTNDPVPIFHLRQGNITPGRELFRMTSTTGRSITFHRGDFQAVFLDNLPDSVNIHTKKRLDSYTQDSDGVKLYFEDGTTATADLVFGADGLQSRVRRKLVEEVEGVTADSRGLHPADPHWSGLLTYRTLIPKEKFVEQGFANHRGLRELTLYIGPEGGLMCYPVSNGNAVNFVGLRHFPEYEDTRYNEEVVEKILRAEGYERPQTLDAKSAAPLIHKNVASGDVWSENSIGFTVDGKRARWFTKISPEELKYTFRSWEPEVQAVLNGIESPICWAVHTAPKLKSFVHKKVCLLGDAAHALHPNHGTGAGLALFDGYVLAHLFAAAINADPSKLAPRVETLLDIFDKVRRPPTVEMAAAARACAYHYNCKVQEGTREKEVWVSLDTNKEEDVKKLQKHLTGGFSYVWDKTIVPAAVKRGLEVFKEMYPSSKL